VDPEQHPDPDPPPDPHSFGNMDPIQDPHQLKILIRIKYKS
jgi:hypothetical protein